ncbi:DNA-binding transcriptional MerR regulator [Clostridium punense]|uniref:DNA-binding transcriptional MerR regulator n=1 Tax=Clostridium punense TaxID=1054297 RepID=A0ABS4K8P5_9CLOT|nr:MULTISPECIES: MerR family transcriptional regulator [Clostridium]EQB89792.1 hypothetical protein M918_18960 [Clostridium sp. BL8]MBP2024145.1 DNA-binding transcriptional MerR regulator [Clostridium punense]
MSRPRSMDVIENSEFITISELVLLSGMRYSTVKYYTEEGLLPFEQIDSRLVRRYPRIDALNRLNEINLLKSNGLTMWEIKGKILCK